MFKIVPNPTFTHDVTVMTPIDGGFADETLIVTFNYLDTNQAEKFEINTVDGTTAFLNAIVVKLDGLTDVEGKPIACSLDLREKLLRTNTVRRAILQHYANAVNKVKEGN
jgi:hypothetical protein